MPRLIDALPSLGARARGAVVLATVAALTGLAVQVAPSALADDASTFSELQAAFAKGGVVHLLAPITESGGDHLTVSPGTPVTLDLNGFALSISSVADNNAAISVVSGADLTVDDSAGGGSLTVTGGSSGAGIGGGRGDSAGSVATSGGTVEARGGINAAGIGGGAAGDGATTTISGGSVSATGGIEGAGIGGGIFGSGAAVTITSPGSATAVNGTDASAIGTGLQNSDGTAEFGSLTNAGSLTIPKGATLTVPDGATATNSGTLALGGTLDGAGTVANSGSAVTATLGGTVDGHGKGPAGTALLVSNHNYDLSFDTRGASSSTPDETYVYAKSFTDSSQSLPAAPTHGSDTFTGWFTAAAGGTQVTNDTDLSTLFGAGPTSATLYAHYRQPSAFTAATSQRLLDTRTGVGAPKAKVGPNGTVVFTVADLPAGTTAVVLNLTGLGLTGSTSTFVSACPAATSAADCERTSELNLNGAGTVANEITVPVATDGMIRLVNHSGRIDLVADLVGYLTAGFTAVGPTRVYDSRASGGPIGANSSRIVTVSGVPQGATAAVVNLTGVGLSGAASTYLSVCPAAQSQTDCAKTSTLNLTGTGALANEITVPIDSTGTLRIYNERGSVNAALDVSGYLSAGYTASGPTRVFDTRVGTGTTKAKLGAHSSRVITLSGLPEGTVAVTLNLTATRLTGSKSTYVTACASADSTSECARVSTINVSGANTVANAITVPVDGNGAFRLYNNSGSIDLLGDLTGTFGS